MLRINHYIPFYSTRRLIAYQTWVDFSDHIFIGSDVIVADVKTGEQLPKTFKELSLPPIEGSTRYPDVQGDKYCRHTQYSGNVDILLPKVLAPMGRADGGSTIIRRGETVPKHYTSSPSFHLGPGEYNVYIRAGWKLNYNKIIFSSSYGKSSMKVWERYQDSTYFNTYREIYSESVYDPTTNMIRVPFKSSFWKLNPDGTKGDLIGTTDVTNSYPCDKMQAYYGMAGVYFYRTQINPYTPELLRQDLKGVQELLDNIQSRLEYTPISCSKTDWDLVSEAMKSINALDSNSLENALQLPALRTLGSDFKKIASGLTNKGLLKVAKAASRAYLIKRYVIDTTLSDANELDEALKKRRAASIPRIQKSDSPILPEKLPAVNVLLRDVDKAVSVLNNEYVKRYCTVYDSYGKAATPFTGGMLTVEKVVFKPLAYTSAQKVWQDLRSWGLDPSLSHLWDLVPFSFVVDWFTKIGDRLEALGDLTFLTTQYDLIMRSTSNKRELTYFVDERGSQYSNPRLIGTLAVSDYERRPYSSFPAFQPTIGKAEPSRQVVAGTALIVQAL